MSWRFKNIALVALCCALTTGLSAWADTTKTNSVTDETETYENVFTGGAAEWNDAGNWELKESGKVPFVSGGNYDAALVTNKTVSTSTAIDGWTLRVGAYNGASVTWSGGITKIQAGTTGCWLTADETSSITIASFGGAQLEGSDSAPFKLTSAKAGGITWSSGLTSASNTSLPFWYYLKGSGTVVYGGDITVANAQVIKQADITLSGTSQVASKTLVTFGSGTTATFAADAIIKLKDSGTLIRGRYVGTVRQSGAAIASTTSNLTTSDDVGSCEIVQATDGIVLYYVDGPASAVKTYTPSININFTDSSRNLTTSADVGLTGYEIPGTSWNNFPADNATYGSVNAVTDSTGAVSIMSGVSVTVSGTRGSWACSSVASASNPLHGYVDEAAGYTTPTVTVTGIPYQKYRVIVYHSTDTANVTFGYDTVNGTDYTYVSSTLTKGAAAWGDSGASNDANAIAEGVNVLVVGGLSGSSLTVVGHRGGGISSARGCIAAVQVVEEALDENDLVIPVAGDMVHTVDSAKNLTGTVYLTGSGTLTLDGSAKITASTINVGEGVTLVVDTTRLDATTFTGSGTVVYTGVAPPIGKGWTASSWTGTVQVKDVTNLIGTSGSGTYIDFNACGNENSVIELNNVTGWVNPNYTCTVPLKLTGTLTLNNGYSGVGNIFTINHLKGDGTIYGHSSAPTVVVRIKEWSGFSGKVQLANKLVVFGEDTLSGSLTQGQIVISSGAVVENRSGEDAGWWAVGGIKVNGELRAPDLDKFGGGTSITTGDDGVFTLVTDGDITSDGDFARIKGTGTLRYEGSGSRTLSAVNFPTGMICENNLSAGLILTSAGGVDTIGSLAGSGVIRCDLDVADRDLRILQSTNTVYSGVFESSIAVKVAPGASSSGTLTLSGVQTASNSLEVESGAAVRLTGAWVGGVDVAGTFGGTGTVDGNLAFDTGSIFKVFAASDDSLRVIGALAYPADDSKVKVDVGAIDTEGVNYIPLVSGLASADLEKFELVDTSLPFEFTFSGGELGLVRPGGYRDLYNDYVTFTLNNIGTTPITNYTLLVRISESQLPGFTYESAGDGSKIAFSDGRGAPLSHEVDTWNTHGESLIWVKVPEAVNGTKITFYWSLKGGKENPENEPGDVWSDYAGVWHMNGATDSTTNKMGGAIGSTSSVVSGGAFGSAVRSSGDGEPLLLADASYDVNSLTNGTFTITFWTYLNSASDGGSSTQYLFSRRETWNDAGYALFMHPRAPGESVDIGIAGGSSGYRYTTVGPLNGVVRDGWMRNDVVYSKEDTKFYWYINGVQDSEHGFSRNLENYNSNPFANGTQDKIAIGGRLVSGDGANSNINGAIDEFRMRAGGIDSTQLAAEIANANFTDYTGAVEGDGVSFLVPGMVVRDGVEHDYWVKDPTITAKLWYSNAKPAVVTYTPGVLRSGAAVTNWCENLLTHEVCDVSSDTLRELPVGSYRIYCARKDAEDGVIEGEKTKTVEFTVAENSGVSTVGDTKGGRILLMNNDSSHGTIAGQGYSDTNETESVYWKFADRASLGGSTMNILDGTNSILWSVSNDKSVTNKLWHLVSCRHGNTFPRDGTDLDASQNYLPWSTSSYSLTNGTVLAQSGADAGQILMLNTTDAMVYSPCYDEGIGTIYFDAVNGWTNNPSAYQLMVEYATVTTNDTPVIDENLWLTDTDSGAVTNWYGNLDEDSWQTCEIKVARVTGGNAIDSISTFTGPFTLAVVSDSPTTGEFYRVYAELNIREPVRFRIRRANFDGDRELDEAYLLLDNIIVSYPAMSATLSPAGQYDDTKKGSNVLGFESAFSSPFPYAGEKLFAKAKVDYYINSATNLTETNFLASAKMYYRWRYLNQPSPDGWEWKRVELFKDGDFFCSTEALDLPEIAGDVEFWYEYTLQAPYYSYVDYTGLPELQNAFAKEYTEATLGPQTNRSTKVDFSYPTMGNDWFVRLREGASSNEVWRIYLRNVDGSAYNADGNGLDYVDFAITESGSWRGFVRTPDTVEAGLEYRIEQINPRADDLALTYSTNFWKGAATFTSTVKSISLVAAADGDEWSPVPCAGTTSFLMFVLDEDTPTLSVTSADLQNFNTWNYANKNEIVFVGTSTDDGKKNGVAPGMNTYSGEFDKWVPSYAEHPDGYWEEHFNETLGTGRFTGYTLIKESTTPNGWEMRNGMWIYEKYKDPNPADSMALQLQGGGNGSLALLGAGDDPRGIESVSFRARIAQSATLDNFAYKDANIGDGDTNYCFIVQAAMSTNAVTATDSWNSGFDGLGQLSLLAGYRQGKGGYEFRIIRWKERRYRAELCKWVGDKCQVVNECEANFNIYSQMPYTMVNDGVDKFPTLFISVDYQDDGSCKVQGGFSYGTAKNGGHSAKGALPDTGEYLTLSFWDAEPPTEWGSYGFASANCDAIFTNARICHSAAPKFDENVTKGTTYPRSAERFKKFNCATYNSYLGSFDSEAISKKKWSIPNRFTTNEVSQILAVADAQPLLIQWRRPTESNESDWKTLVTNEISSFTLSEVMEVPLLLTEDAYIRLKHGGGSGNVVDIAVDDVAIRQWRGDDYNSAKQTYFLDKGNGSPTNFVFTSAWLNDEGSVELTAARAMTNKVSSLRSPLMDGADGRGLGLGMFSFSYTNADSRAVLLLQVATGNNLANATLAEYTEALSDDTRWETVTNFVFSGLSEEKLAGGVMSHYLGRYGEKGVMRLVVDGQSVADAQASRDSTYGRIFITDVICRDEPKLDTSSWWGWNIRTSQDLYSNDDRLLANLADWPGSVGADAGMSLALNNSAEDDIDILEGVTYRQHQPFLQTPVFTNKTAVGEISFKARRYDYPSEFMPRVCVYGAHNGTEPDEEWKYVTHFDVTNDYYTTYTFKEKGTLGYEVLRLVVVGVDLVESHHGNLDDPGYGATPVVRVALDDVVVTEALMPKLAFRNVFAFRGDGSTDLLNTKYVNRFGDKAVQPLAGEAWGVQAEIYAEQLPDEIDFDRGVTVTLYWFDGGVNPWGYDNWKNRGSSEVHSAKLAECDDVSLAFRSSYAGEDGSSVVGQASEYSSGSIVQYMLKAEYYLKGDSAVRSVEMGSSEWVKPEWYNGVDYNSKYNGFSAYTILDSVAPGWAWINEVNIFGGFDDDNNIDKAMQYVEVAMPIEADLTGWHLDFLTRDNNNNILTNKAYTFSADQTTGRTKTKNGDSNCVFYVISGPESEQNLQALTVNVKGVEKKVEIDGTWLIESDKRSDFLYGDEGLDAMLKPIGMLLVRSSDIVEHSIVLEGTNYYYKIPNRSASAFAEHLSTVSPGIEWVAVGDDSIAGDHSLGVTNLPANVVANWNNMMARTPGFINDNQKIDPVHPVANSSSYIVYATFADDSAGHMTQTLGHHVGTTSLAMAVVPKGTATNITYNVENWYELASVTVDGVEQSLANRTGSVEVPLGGPATSNNISVVASSRIATTLSEDWGLTATNRYTSAVVDWLNKGSTLRGAFANPAGKIAAAQFVPLSRNPDAFRDLTLTEMYWLDIDPTDIDSITGSNNWWFVGGMIKPPIPNVIVKPSYQDGLDESNLTMGMYMCITNTATSDYFAPYVLRGVEVGSVSTNYSISGTTQWEGPTFKILGRLFNTDIGGNPDEFAAWLPLRSFVLNENSFRPKGESDEFQSVIEVFDPYSTDSVGGANAGWGKFKGKSTVFFSWSIDDEDCLVSTNPLCPTNSVSK